VWFSLFGAFVRSKELPVSVVIICLLCIGTDHRATKAPFMSPGCEKPTRGSSVRGRCFCLCRATMIAQRCDGNNATSQNHDILAFLTICATSHSFVPVILRVGQVGGGSIVPPSCRLLIVSLGPAGTDDIASV
jgi:hypothetical protein